MVDSKELNEYPFKRLKKFEDTKLGKHVEEETISERSRLVDRISSLPDELLAHVLSLLPTTRCAGRTSILSTRWRYLFTLTTSLSFDVVPCRTRSNYDEKIEATRRRFKEFVDKVLEMHRSSSINKFSLLCRGSNKFRLFCRGNADLYLDWNRWLISVVRKAVQKGVQELHYELASGDYYCVPKCRLPKDFFLCETLLKLRIKGFAHSKIHIPHSLVWLPKLKIIHLDNIRFLDFDSMNRLFSSCQVLEELSLKSCFCRPKHGTHVVYRSVTLRVLTMESCTFVNGTLEIDAPNLAYLTYNTIIGLKITPSWKYSASFVNAELIFQCVSSYTEVVTIGRSTVEHEWELLKAAANKTTELHFKYNSAKILLRVGENNEEMPDFSNLTKLELDYFRYEACTLEHVRSLIDKSPRLETLIVETECRRCSCSIRKDEDGNVVCCCDSQSLSSSDRDLMTHFHEMSNNRLKSANFLRTSNGWCLRGILFLRTQSSAINSEEAHRL